MGLLLLSKPVQCLRFELLTLSVDELRKNGGQPAQAVVWDRWIEQDVLPTVQDAKVGANDLAHEDGDDQFPRMMGDADLLLDVDRGQAVLGEQDDDGVAGLDGLGDLLAQLLTGTDVVLSQVDLDPGSRRLGTYALHPVGVSAAVAEEDSELGRGGATHPLIIPRGSDERHGCNFTSPGCRQARPSVIRYQVMGAWQARAGPPNWRRSIIRRNGRTQH